MSKLIKLEKMNNGRDYGYVGQLTGTVYYSGTRFSCTWWQAQPFHRFTNRDRMEADEFQLAERRKAEREAMREA